MPSMLNLNLWICDHDHDLGGASSGDCGEGVSQQQRQQQQRKSMHSTPSPLTTSDADVDLPHHHPSSGNDHGKFDYSDDDDCVWPSRPTMSPYSYGTTNSNTPNSHSHSHSHSGSHNHNHNHNPPNHHHHHHHTSDQAERSTVRSDAQLLQLPVVSIGGSVFDTRGSTVHSSTENAAGAGGTRAPPARTFYKRKVFGATSVSAAVAPAEQPPHHNDNNVGDDDDGVVGVGVVGARAKAVASPSALTTFGELNLAGSKGHHSGMGMEMEMKMPQHPHHHDRHEHHGHPASPSRIQADAQDLAHFHEMYSKLCIFKNTFEHTNVPKITECFLLGSWVQQLRKRKKNQSLRERGIKVANELPPLSMQQVQMLDALGFSWKAPSHGEQEAIIAKIKRSKASDGASGPGSGTGSGSGPSAKVKVSSTSNINSNNQPSGSVSVEDGIHHVPDIDSMSDRMSMTPDPHDDDVDVDVDAGDMLYSRATPNLRWDYGHRSTGHHRQDHDEDDDDDDDECQDHHDDDQYHGTARSFGSEHGPEQSHQSSTEEDDDGDVGVDVPSGNAPEHHHPRGRMRMNSMSAPQFHYVSQSNTSLSNPSSLNSHSQHGHEHGGVGIGIGVGMSHNYSSHSHASQSVYSSSHTCGSSSVQQMNFAAPSEAYSSHYAHSNYNGSHCGGSTATTNNMMTFAAPSEVYSSHHYAHSNYNGSQCGGSTVGANSTKNLNLNHHHHHHHHQMGNFMPSEVQSSRHSAYGSQCGHPLTTFAAPSEVYSSHYANSNYNGSQCQFDSSNPSAGGGHGTHHGNIIGNVNSMAFATPSEVPSSHHSVYSNHSGSTTTANHNHPFTTALAHAAIRAQSVYSQSNQSVDFSTTMSCRSSNSNSDAMRHHAQIIGLKRKSTSTDCDVLSCASVSASASASVSVHSSHCVAEKNWKLKFNSLLKFKAENGHCDVPARYDEDPKLGHWVMTQRRQYHLMQKGKDTRMTQARIALLERVGLQWSVRMNPTNLWNRRLQELRDYKEKHGNCLVPQRFSKNPQLGTWVNTQRRHYKFLTSGKKSCLTKERLEKLEELGFVWSTHNLPSKDGGAQEFIAYMHGNDTMTSGPGGSTSVAKKSSGNGANTSASVSRNAKKSQKS